MPDNYEEMLQDLDLCLGGLAAFLPSVLYELLKPRDNGTDSKK